MNDLQPATPATFFEDGEARICLEKMLPAYVAQCRWFGGKARDPRDFTVTQMLPMTATATIALVQVRYSDESQELYQVPLQVTREQDVEGLLAGTPSALVARMDGLVVIDAIHDPAFRAELWRRMTGGAGEPPASTVLRVEQSNSSLLYGGSVFVKLFRKLEVGVNPDCEVLRFLTERQHFRHAPAFVGAFELQDPCMEPTLLALGIGAVKNEGDAWSFALAEVAEYYARVTDRGDGSAAAIGESFLERAAQLGTRTGELHMALAAEETDPRFTPEPLAREDFQELQSAIEKSWKRVLESSPTADLSTRSERVAARARRIGERSISATKIRTHGDFHLGQVLNTGSDFVIIDFEGEPSRSLAERRRKRSPMRDVAGMLRSFHYAAHAGLMKISGEHADLDGAAELWSRMANSAFFNAWKEATNGASFRPPSDADLAFLLEAFLLEKVIYEIAYELNNRPAWLPIPLRGLDAVLGR